jgi:hypothetical protein
VTPAVPTWIQTFVLVGVALVVLLVPLKVVYEMTKGTRDRRRKLQDLVDRVRERFGSVKLERGLFAADRIAFTHEERAASITQPDDDELLLRLEPRLPLRFPLVVRTRGVSWPFAVLWESFRFLPRVKTFEPLIDESIDCYASGSFGALLRDLAGEGLPAGGKPTGLAESLIVLRRTPGVRRFELRISASGGFRILFELHADDLRYRADELESVVHHAWRIHDLLSC